MTIAQFIEAYSIELQEGTAAYFVGAGISKPSSLPDWIELLQPFSYKLGILDLKGKDLPLMAQYVINEEAGNRGPFINSISRKLRKKWAPNIYHESIVRTNVKTIWTTNYDNILESAYGNQVDVKFNDDAISRDIPGSEAEIIKMHGCIYNSDRSEIVITESDYEDFFINKPATANRLRVDLLQKSFLFVGYGYGDPNIKNILTEARRLSKNITRQHYLITKSQEGSEFMYWCKNLRKYGIRVITINEYSELETILELLSLKSRGKSVFITGSHNTKDDIDIRSLSNALAKDNSIILNDGQSTGVMRIATRSYMESVIEQNSDINKRLKFFANPYAANPKFTNDLTLIPMLKQWRSSLFRATHIVIAFDGGMGTQAEIEKALELGCIVIPYFKNKTSPISIILKDNTLEKRLEKYDPTFLAKAQLFDLKINDVITLVSTIFNSK